MVAILEVVFRSFWTWAGTLMLLVAVADVLRAGSSTLSSTIRHAIGK